jgi:hypothetical protein
VLAEIAAAGRGELSWVPRDLAAGLYVMVLRARAEGSAASLAVARALRLEAP